MSNRPSGWAFLACIGFACSLISARGGTLTWDPSPDADVAGYYLYSGTNSGTYTQRIDLGSTTSTNLAGLALGSSTYYFVITAYDSNGFESDPSNELVYIEPAPVTSDLDTANKLHLLFPVAAGQSYDIQCSTTLTNWFTLITIFSPTNGTYDFLDANFAGSQRFYRVSAH